MVGERKGDETPSGWLRFGFWTTGVYTLLLTVVLASSWWGWCIWVDFGKVSLNELGDFLAGAFAPMAFLWLFVAVMMQSTELALQREELALTRRELADTRGEIALQAAATRASADFVGQQTEILRRQSEREEVRNAGEQFDSLVKTTAALVRTRIAGELQFNRNGVAEVTLLSPNVFTTDDQVSLIAASRQMRKVISARRTQIEAGELILSAPFSARKLNQLIQALDSMAVLNASAPHIGPFLTALEFDSLRDELMWLAQLPQTA